MIARLLLTALFSALLIGLAPDKTSPANLNNSTDLTPPAAQAVEKKLNNVEPSQTVEAVEKSGVEPEKPQTQTKVAVQEKPITGSKEDWMTQAGIPQDEWAAVDYINSRESVWCPTRWQGEYGTCPDYHGTPTDPSTGYGLCQSTPANKMAAAGDDWATNPVTQLKWCSMHASSRHGGWWASFAYWQAHRNW